MKTVFFSNKDGNERVVQWLKYTMNKFVDHFRNPQDKLKTVQAQALANEFCKIANQLVDANGNKIFRYNCRTKNIELADGRGLSEKPQSEDEIKARYRVFGARKKLRKTFARRRQGNSQAAQNQSHFRTKQLYCGLTIDRLQSTRDLFQELQI